MRLGFENKKQIYLLGSLLVLLVAIGSWELYDGIGSSASAASSPAPGKNVAPAAHLAATASPSSDSSSEPRLRIAELARTESTEYSSSGRNIFSIDAPPVVIEAPIAPVRAVAVAAGPPRPVVPPIDLKYLGYTQSIGESAYKAVLVQGDESLLARTGDIVFHRYKVGPIQPTFVQITDLSYKHTQSIPVTETKTESASSR